MFQSGGMQVAPDFNSPISRAIPPGETSETLAMYRRSQEKGREEYAAMVTTFYDLMTDFYEYGWGQSFHFAPGRAGESFEASISRHQHFLGDAMGLKPGMKVLDMGCGVGGPQRYFASEFGCSVVGLNISKYQIGKCDTYNRKAGLDHLCSLQYGNFMDIPAEEGSFDAAYQIEALPHAPDKAAVYSEVFRVLRPGAPFVGYDWCTTAIYDDAVPGHRDLIRSIECSNAMPRMGPFSEVRRGLESAGFVDVRSSDRAEDADAETPWYRPLESLELSLKSLPRTPLGRRITSSALSILESLRLVPRGSREVQEVLNVAADSIVAGGRLGIFTPMFFHSARKPDNPRS